MTIDLDAAKAAAADVHLQPPYSLAITLESYEVALGGSR